MRNILKTKVVGILVFFVDVVYSMMILDKNVYDYRVRKEHWFFYTFALCQCLDGQLHSAKLQYGNENKTSCERVDFFAY